MPLPNVFSDKKDNSLFLAVFLSDTAVRSALWRIDESEIEIIKTSKLLDFSDLEDLLVKTDASLQELGAMSEKTDQVLFCLESSWANGGVSDEKKPILKKLSKSLSLKAVGFVVGSEVILDYLKNEKAVNIALLLAVQKSSLELLFVEAGSVLAKESVGKSDDLSADLTEALARLEKSPAVVKRSYPPRIILYSTEVSNEQLGKEQQKLIKKDWRESHNFLQRPVVEIIKPKESIEAIIKTGGKVAGKAQGLLNDEELTSAQTAVSDLPIQENKPSFAKASKGGNNFGFKELAVDGQSKATKADDNLSSIDTAKSFGVPIKTTTKPKKAVAKIMNFPKAKINFNANLIADEISHHKLMALGFVLGLIFLFFGSIITFSSMTKFSVFVTPISQVVSKDVVITLDSNISESDLDNMILAARVAEKKISGSSNTASTGVKIIGEAASGRVEILNKTDSEKTFAKGTQISADGKIFLTDEELTVSAAEITSSDDGETKVYGKKEVSVTAEEIGAEGNIAGNSNFVVEDFASSSYEAKSLEAFTGGASREIQVVSKQDVADIMTDLENELIELANTQFADDSKDGQYFVVTGNTKVLNEEYSDEIGDEVNTFSLDLELSVEAYSYNAQDLEPLAQSTLSSELPDGFVLVGDAQILSSPSDSEDEAEEVVLEANLSSNSQASLNKEALLSEILGRSTVESEKILTAKDKIKSIKIDLEPSFAARIVKKIPKDEKRVTIIVSGEE